MLRQGLGFYFDNERSRVLDLIVCFWCLMWSFCSLCVLIWSEEFRKNILLIFKEKKRYFLYKMLFLWVKVQCLTNGHVSKKCFWNLLEWIASMFLYLNSRSIFLFSILWIIAVVSSTQQSEERHPLVSFFFWKFWLCWVFLVACGLFIAVYRLL